MKKSNRPVNNHKAYHAHVYFNKNTIELATKLCQQAGILFGLKIGTVHQKPVGPHPMWSCQILFASKHFDQLVPWLEKNREGLTVFIHPLTGDDIQDHSDFAYWLGKSVELDLKGL